MLCGSETGFRTKIRGHIFVAMKQADVEYYCLDSTNQTVIVNESTSSDGSAAVQLRQQLAAPPSSYAASQPAITVTSSAPDVFYSEPPRPPTSIASW